MKRLAGLLLAVALLAGCGHSDTAMDHKFQRLDYEMSTLETVNSAFNEQHFARLTQRYIALVHQYEGQLGPARARKMLIAKGDELDTYCLPCTGVLYIEARKF
jgi:hypothetical protein